MIGVSVLAVRIPRTISVVPQLLATDMGQCSHRQHFVGLQGFNIRCFDRHDGQRFAQGIENFQYVSILAS